MVIKEWREKTRDFLKLNKPQTLFYDPDVLQKWI